MARLPHLTRVARHDSLSAADLDHHRDRGDPFPVVEPGRVTFAYHGPVNEVVLDHYGVGLPEDLRFEHLGGSDWHTLTLQVPHETRLEYKLWVTDTFGRRLIEDPLNPKVAAHAFGANSVLEADGYAVPWWAIPDDAAPPGRQVDYYLDSRALHRKVSATVYLPNGMVFGSEQRYPLLVVHDGSDYLNYAAAATSLDNLIHRHELPPTVAVFLHAGERLVEYADDNRHTAMLVDELLVELRGDLPLRTDPAGCCLLGASFGAVAALAAAHRRPGVFGRLALQSGSFATAGPRCRERVEPLWDPVKRFVGDFMAGSAAVAERVFVSCGAYESLICENQAMVAHLRSTGAEVRFALHLDGHNWECWRDSLGIGLPWLLGADR